MAVRRSSPRYSINYKKLKRFRRDRTSDLKVTLLMISKRCSAEMNKKSILKMCARGEMLRRRRTCRSTLRKTVLISLPTRSSNSSKHTRTLDRKWSPRKSNTYRVRRLPRATLTSKPCRSRRSCQCRQLGGLICRWPMAVTRTARFSCRMPVRCSRGTLRRARCCRQARH